MSSSKRKKNGHQKHPANGYKHPAIEPALARHARGEAVPKHELHPKAAPEDPPEDVRTAVREDESQYSAAHLRERELMRYQTEFLHVPVRLDRPNKVNS